MSRTIILFMTLLLGSLTLVYSQKPAQTSSVDIYNKVEKLNVLGSVLYVAAHPDDENTRLISYFANERKVRTAYLSLTRGDGGQNLIGTEIWEKLGLIRTNELLQARTVDGGQQFFSRANDFGYSKHPDETLAFWNKDEVMHDIVKVIREFKPDIIVNRFDYRRAGRTHGHHTSSAILSVEAFDLVGQESFLKDRLPHLEPWQPERIFWNTGWWFYGGRDNFEKADKSKLVAVDAGVYYQDRGLSNTEIAALSRTMHKSQGFGSTGTRGTEMEYLDLIKGSTPGNNQDPLSDIDMSWNRVPGGALISKNINTLLSNFNFTEPSENIPSLIKIHKEIQSISNDHWKSIKTAEIENIIADCAGIYLEAKADTPFGTRGQDIGVDIELVNRSDAPVTFNNAKISSNNTTLDINLSLGENEKKILETSFLIPETMEYSNPYWLNKKGTLGMYHVEDQTLIGQPVSNAAFTIQFNLEIQGIPINIEKNVIFKRNDPVDGEVYAPFYVVPQASIQFTDPIYIFSNREPKEISVIVKSFKDNFKGTVALQHPNSWIIDKESEVIEIGKRGEEKIVKFKVKGPYLSESSEMSLELKSEDGTLLNQSVTEIKYDHIPAQVLLTPATSKFERLNIQIKGKEIAYLQGAGDDVPISLRQIGYNVTEIEVDDILPGKLENYDALVMGIRAYNTKPELILKKQALMDYMNAGGTVIVQYNTSRRIKGDDIGPYPMELSRDRVTDETASVSFTNADHEVLNYPNKITTRDFEGWVQERGLYFPNQWDDQYAAPLACSDKAEPLRQGGLLVAEVGEGYFIYTGYSWFRQLPAGVSGAFRLFANMLSIGKNEMNNSTSTTGSNE